LWLLLLPALLYLVKAAPIPPETLPAFVDVEMEWRLLESISRMGRPDLESELVIALGEETWNEFASEDLMLFLKRSSILSSV
jgi:hypothetical protein